MLRITQVAMAAWACGDACAKGRADEQAAYALRTLSNAAPRGFAAREASDVAWALAAARERLLPPAATDNATVADVAAFLDRLADHARSVSYAPRDVATALWACAKIAEADWRAQAASLRAVAALRANADRIKGPWPPRDAAQAAAAVASAAVDAPEVLDRATAAAARGCDRWSLRDVADVLWACARLDRPPAADAVAALCGARAVRRASAGVHRRVPVEVHEDLRAGERRGAAAHARARRALQRRLGGRVPGPRIGETPGRGRRHRRRGPRGLGGGRRRRRRARRPDRAGRRADAARRADGADAAASRAPPRAPGARRGRRVGRTIGDSRRRDDGRAAARCPRGLDAAAVGAVVAARGRVQGTPGHEGAARGGGLCGNQNFTARSSTPSTRRFG